MSDALDYREAMADAADHCGTCGAECDRHGLCGIDASHDLDPRCTAIVGSSNECGQPVTLDDPDDPESWVHADHADITGFDHTAEHDTENP